MSAAGRCRARCAVFLEVLKAEFGRMHLLSESAYRAFDMNCTHGWPETCALSRMPSVRTLQAHDHCFAHSDFISRSATNLFTTLLIQAKIVENRLRGKVPENWLSLSR